ncbi:MAG: DNA primase [Atopobiaceae bacterium]|nr:DNA primase [Atopobiaceae bacterium]
MISEEDMERVRQATDIVQLVGETVPLRQRGTDDWWGCCPFHHEKSPSFHINSSTGLWKCFGCGEGGNLFGYIMRREGLEFPDAVRFLADRAGIELVEERGTRRGPKRNRLIECLTEASAYYTTMLLRGRGGGPDSGRRYLSGRGFGSTICRRWGLGYAPGRGSLVAHLTRKGFTAEELLTADLAIRRESGLQDRFFARVMFPICDEQGRVIAFGGRVIDDGKPKYLNTKETPVFHKGKHLYAFDRAKETIAARGVAIVCEGYTDVIAMHEAGYTNTVAALGTSFSIDHVRTLARFARRIICMFDGDAAGQRAAERAIQFLDKSEADLRCVVLPGGQDPAEFLEAYGAAELQLILDEAQPLMSFVLGKRLEGINPSTPAGVRANALNEVATMLAPLKDSYVLDGYAMEVAERLGFSVEDVKRTIKSKPVAAADPSPRHEQAQHAQGYAGYDDYVPSEAYESQSAYYAEPSAFSAPVLTTDERMQLQAEKELLALIAVAPDEMRAHDGRIATFSWADERDEVMAWAMLATPVGTAPADVVRAAEAVVPDASYILASGRIANDSDMDKERKVAFLLDTVELYSTKQRIRELRARMREGSGDSGALFYEAANLQKHASDLQMRLSQNNVR